MISLAPYSPDAALQVFRFMDPADQAEAWAVRGVAAHYLDLFVDWSVMQRRAPLSMVLHDDPRRGGRAFAVLALSDTGQAGVAQAALLARNHRQFRRALAEAGAQIRAGMPAFCSQAGIQRIEARCAADHPTAALFLTMCGFELETEMPGFGGARHPTCFCQFAWTAPASDVASHHTTDPTQSDPKEADPCAL